MQTGQRDSNIELFRILTMLLIIAHHYVMHGQAYSLIDAAPTSASSLFLLIFGAWGKMGINCFVLITGYFMCKSHITVRKFVKLLAEIMLYNILTCLIFLATGIIPFSITEILKIVLPIRGVDRGFTSCYLLFYPLIPFINILLRNISQKQHLLLILLLLFIYTGIGSLPQFEVSMNYVSWFSVLYILAAYLRMYPNGVLENKKLWGWLTAGMLLISSLSVVAMTVLLGHTYSYWFVYDANKIFALLTAITAFLFFKNIKLRPNRFINGVAAATFGVLLIHDNSGATRRWLWNTLLGCEHVYGTPWLPLHAVGCVLGVFIVCAAIDCLRIRFLERPFLRLWDRLWRRITPKYADWEPHMLRKLGMK